MKWLRLVLAALVAASAWIMPRVVSAQYSSGSYRVEEVQFGAGGDRTSSGSYQAQQNAGNLVGGKFASTTYQVFGGFITPNEEFLEMTVSPSFVNLGQLTATATSTGVSYFSIRSYLNSSYVVALLSDSLTNESGVVIDPMTSAGSSTIGTEQFGINLVANTSPVAQGDDPAPFPDNTFAYGEAAPGYDTANTYKFNKFDIIARSLTNGWGQTDFTVSYIANIATTTAAGAYNSVQNIVITATY